MSDARVACNVETGRALVEGLHPATGVDGSLACSGNMLLQALVACAGITLNAVATALGFRLRAGAILAEGALDFRGRLGVDKEVPVGLREILRFVGSPIGSPGAGRGASPPVRERLSIVGRPL